MISLKTAATALAVLAQANAWAGSGADVLIQSAGGNVPQAAVQGQESNPLLQAFSLAGIQLNDPFNMQFFTEWQNQKNLSYEVNNWVLKVLKADYVAAGHLWSAIETRLPEGFANSARTAQLYVLWKMGLSQTFFDSWVKALGEPEYMNSRISTALEQTMGPTFDRWLVDNAITVAPEQIPTLEKLDLSRGVVALNVQAYLGLRKGERAKDILEKLPVNHAFKIPLTQTVMLALAKKGELGAAGKVLKTQLEPAIEAKKDPLLLSNYYLQLARLLYQAQALDSSEQFYKKIPNRAPEFFTAREELTWVLLRKGETAKLRGELATLTLPIFEDQFAPESFLVRAISNLKLCLYDKVEKDFKDFTRVNARWVKEIDAALKATDPVSPKTGDFYSEWADRAIPLREAESKRLEVLGVESIQAALPAVGIQAHWTKAKDKMVAFLDLAKKQRSNELRRLWKNRKDTLAEAIRKMQFVKVEYMTQVRELAQQSDQALTVASASADEVKTTSAHAVSQTKDQDIVFPTDGVYWPDETFKLRSTAQNECMKRIKKE